jgi:hypothetical protein
MQQLKDYKIIFLVFFKFLILLSACKSADKSKQLLGKWQMVFDKNEVSLAMKPAEKKILATLLDKEQANAWREIEQKIKQNTFEFRANKTFELILKEEIIREKGTWELKDNLLILTKPKSATQKAETKDELLVKTLENNRLVLEYKNPQGIIKQVAWQLIK